MHLHPRIPRPRSIAAVAISIGLGSVASFALVTDASAHANIVHGTSVCNQTDGTYTITWTIANDYNLSDTVSKVSDTGGGTLSGLPATIAASPHTPYNTATATQTGVPGTATTATLTINGLWSDGYHQQDGASVTLGGNCVIPPTRTTTAAATFTDATCAAATGSYTIPSSTSADYFVAINGGASAAAAAGTVSEPAGTAIVVTAHAKTGFVLTGTTNWSHTIAAATGCTTSPPPSSPPPSSPPPVVHPATIAPAVPTITQGVCVSGKQTSAFFTIPGITGVTYLANGVSVAAGNHNVAYGSTTTVTAAALAGYSFPAGTTTSWTLVANAALPSCAAAPTAVLGITFNNPPATPPVKSPPSAVLPFTGMPLVPTALAGLGLLLTGLLLVGSSRRHRTGQLTWIEK